MTDSLHKRYTYKFIGNCAGLLISVVTQSIIPRGLGPKAYGDFNFLTNFFNQAVSFLDMGTSEGFYIKLSQRQRDSGLVLFYLLYVLSVALAICSFVGVSFAASTHTYFWPNQSTFYIILAAIWALLSWLVQIMNKMGDAFGLTVSAELARIIQKGLGLALIVLLFLFNSLNLVNFFLPLSHYGIFWAGPCMDYPQAGVFARERLQV